MRQPSIGRERSRNDSDASWQVNTRTAAIGTILFGGSLGIFGLLAADNAKQQLYYQLALFVGFLLPVWLDPILTVKRLMDGKSYHETVNMGVVLLFLVALSVVFLVLLFMTN
jgi:hypothetical protein